MGRGALFLGMTALPLAVLQLSQDHSNMEASFKDLARLCLHRLGLVP